MRTDLIQDNFYRQFGVNFFSYLKIVTEKKHNSECRKRHYHNYVLRMKSYVAGESTTNILAVSFQMAIISDLPVGTWLFGDIGYLYKNGIILAGENCNFEISSMYMTDGVYFYSKHIDHAVPLGTRPEFQKLIDDCFDLRTWRYKQPL